MNLPRLPFVLLAALVVLPPTARSAELPAPGVPNFFQVNDRLYRGGQPSHQGWKQLAALGVKVVIDLRRESEHSTAAEARAVQAAGMRYVSIPMNGFDTPQADQIGKVLALLDGPDATFIHCKLGMDRTGSVVAAYRISRDRWANEKALSEAMSCGLHWYELGMKRFIRGYKAAPEPLASVSATTQSVAVPDSLATAGAR